MIYDPITRQPVKIIGRYRPQTERYHYGRRERGEFCYVRVRYIGRSYAGGFPVGSEQVIDRTELAADHGNIEINLAAAEVPFLN